jgi:hypothetical protein
MRIFILSAVFAASIGCGPAEKAPNLASPAAPPAAASSAAAPPAPPPPAVAAKPTAKILGVEASKESALYHLVRIAFENPTPGPCKIQRYTVRWGNDAKSFDTPFSIPPGESRERGAKIHPNDGDVEALTVNAATIEIEATCP